MHFLKRSLLYILICLCIVSVYKDLQKDTTQYDQIHSLKVNSEKNSYRVIKVKLNENDTFLSVIEQLHKDKLVEMNIDKMIHDFENLNPNANPYNLEPGTFYLFPLY